MQIFIIPVIGYFLCCLYPACKILDSFKNTKKKKDDKPRLSFGASIGIIVGFSIAYYLVIMFCFDAFNEYVIGNTCGAWGESCNYFGTSVLISNAIFLINIAMSIFYAFICQFALINLLPDRKATFLVLSHMYFVVSVFFTFLLTASYFGLFVSYYFDPFTSLIRIAAVLSPMYSYLLVYKIFSIKYKRD